MGAKTKVFIEVRTNEDWEDVLLIGTTSSGWVLTGMTLEIDLRVTAGAADPADFTLQNTGGSPELFVDDDHELRIYVPRAAMTLDPGVYVGDLLMVDPETDDETVLCEVTVTVVRGITSI